MIEGTLLKLATDATAPVEGVCRVRACTLHLEAVIDILTWVLDGIKLVRSHFRWPVVCVELGWLRAGTYRARALWGLVCLLFDLRNDSYDE